jgi:hypothetical protein
MAMDTVAFFLGLRVPAYPPNNEFSEDPKKIPRFGLRKLLGECSSARARESADRRFGACHASHYLLPIAGAELTV